MQADTAMPIQSAPQVSQTQPISYAAPVAQTASQAPVVSTTSQWVAPYQQATAPAPQMQAQMGVSPSQYAPTASYPQAYQAAPQAPQAPQAENPYKEAFNRVVGLLSSPVQFPFQGQQSQTSTQYAPANYSSQAVPQYSNQGTETYTPGINNSQGYFNGYSQTSPAPSLQQQAQASGVSQESLNVIDHFGADAPAILNDYSCKIEDALIVTNNQLVQAVNLLQELSSEHRAYEAILTDPDVLADYTCEFFGENGPYPIPDETPVYGQSVGQQFARPAAAPAPQYQRPEMPVPPQPQQAQGVPADFWNSFGSLAERDPANAWRYLNAAQQNPDVFRQKLLVME
jgi:hypothetical protein